MVWQESPARVADKQMAANLYAHLPRLFTGECGFLHYANGSAHAMTDDLLRPSLNTRRDQLSGQLLALDNDCVPGIVSAGIAANPIVVIREHITTILPFPLIAPLRADNNWLFPFFSCFSS